MLDSNIHFYLQTETGKHNNVCYRVLNVCNIRKKRIETHLNAHKTLAGASKQVNILMQTIEKDKTPVIFEFRVHTHSLSL